MDKISCFDTTLRDGAQGEGVSFSIEDKLSIARTLDKFGMDYIEAGNPGSNRKDFEFFKNAASLRLEHSKLVAFGSTRKLGVAVEDDPAVRRVDELRCDCVAIFGKSWLLHVTEILGCTPDENLTLIFDTISYHKKRGREVVFDAEHFFDGAADNPEYAMRVLKTARDAGADVLVLCDTNGGALPGFVRRMTEKAAVLDAPLGIHCHNDAGLAVANSLAAVEAGARHIQGTFNGIGERCGNAALSTLIPNLQLKMNYLCAPAESVASITSTARYIAEISNMTIPGGQPYVGASAFAHKAGMHADGICKTSKSFEHVNPADVGNGRRLLASEIAGRSLLTEKIRSIVPGITRDSEDVQRIANRLRELEFDGYQFDGAEASFELLVRRELGLYAPSFELLHFKIIGEQPPMDNRSSSAIIKVRVDSKVELTAAEGDGPVHALDNALRRALTTFYEEISEVHLVDYKVRVMDSKAATAARVRVLITSADKHGVWTTVGVSTDIIEASWIALVDSIEYCLIRGRTFRM